MKRLLSAQADVPEKHRGLATESFVIQGNLLLFRPGSRRLKAGHWIPRLRLSYIVTCALDWWSRPRVRAAHLQGDGCEQWSGKVLYCAASEWYLNSTVQVSKRHSRCPCAMTRWVSSCVGTFRHLLVPVLQDLGRFHLGRSTILCACWEGSGPILLSPFNSLEQGLRGQAMTVTVM